MRTMEKNKRTFYYCLYKGTERLQDEYGNVTGEEKVIYSRPIQMRANISAAYGTTQVEQFGNVSAYDKVIVTDDINCPINENTVLFIDKKPEFDKDDNPIYDYVVKRVAKSLNSLSIAISKVEVS